MKVEDVAPYLSATGFGLISADADDAGADDVAGQFLLYAGDLITAIQLGAELPPLPDAALKAGDRLNGGTRLTLSIVGANLAIFQGRISAGKPKLAITLRYINQILVALMIPGRAMPPVPGQLTTQ